MERFRVLQPQKLILTVGVQRPMVQARSRRFSGSVRHGHVPVAVHQLGSFPLPDSERHVRRWTAKQASGSR